jgi:hypothetical protein
MIALSKTARREEPGNSWRERNPVPEMLARKAGITGAMQGEKKSNTPAKNEACRPGVSITQFILALFCALY